MGRHTKGELIVAIYDSDDAKVEAAGFAKKAIEAGWLAPVSPVGFGGPAAAGKNNALFVGAFIKQLAIELQSL